MPPDCRARRQGLGCPIDDDITLLLLLGVWQESEDRLCHPAAELKVHWGEVRQLAKEAVDGALRPMMGLLLSIGGGGACRMNIVGPLHGGCAMMQPDGSVAEGYQAIATTSSSLAYLVVTLVR